MLRFMDAAQALADLTEISSQVEQVAIVDRDGSLLASTARDPVRAERFAAGIARLLDEADGLAKARGLAELTQLEVSTLGGSIFVVRRAGRMVAATTRADPTVGLIFYDLKHCLGSIEETAGVEETGSLAEASGEGDTTPAAPADPATNGRHENDAPGRTARTRADTSA
jgi:predicted regulator of Ras-like GTPase activity (Roadblock/LC7/MglB family)